jgi:rhodanese-related sulfurtransferase
MRTLTLNQRLAMTALLLGAVAVFADVHRGRTLSFHEQELARVVERAEDHVTPAELAAWIIEGRGDYRLVDLRDEKAYAEYHIPTAEDVPLTTLVDADLPHDEKLVLYSDGGIHASQALMFLWGRGYRNAYTLLGGLDAWKDEVLFPVIPAQATTEERVQFERALQMAKFFGGQARAAAAPGGAPAEMPKVEASALSVPPPPAPGAGSGGAAPKKKKREGC